MPPLWRRPAPGSITTAAPETQTAPAPSSPIVTSSRSIGGGTRTAARTVQRQVDLPKGILPIEFSLVNVAASLSNSQLFRFLGNSTTSQPTQIGYIVPFRGSIVAITLSATAAISSGTLTITAFRAGATTGAALVRSTGSTGFTNFSPDTHPFNAGDKLDLRITTTSNYLPITNDIEAVLYLAQKVD